MKNSPIHPPFPSIPCGNAPVSLWQNMVGTDHWDDAQRKSNGWSPPNNENCSLYKLASKVGPVNQRRGPIFSMIFYDWLRRPYVYPIVSRAWKMPLMSQGLKNQLVPAHAVRTSCTWYDCPVLLAGKIRSANHRYGPVIVSIRLYFLLNDFCSPQYLRILNSQKGLKSHYIHNRKTYLEYVWISRNNSKIDHRITIVKKKVIVDHRKQGRRSPFLHRNKASCCPVSPAISQTFSAADPGGKVTGYLGCTRKSPNLWREFYIYSYQINSLSKYLGVSL